MYLTGFAYNLKNRIHALPTGQIDINLFAMEGSGYLNAGYSSSGALISVEKELRNQTYRLNHNPNGLVNKYYIDVKM